MRTPSKRSAFTIPEPRVSAKVVLPPVRLIPACGGQCALYTRRSPIKETPNQDVAAIVPHSANAGAILVADGLGGLLTGEVAAGIAVSTVRDSIRRLAAQHHRKSSRSNAHGLTPADAMHSAIVAGLERANERVLIEAFGSATTIAVIVIDAANVRSYHVGDSMALVCGLRGKLKHLTESHSPVGLAMKAGVIDETEAMHHAKRHLVSNVIGSPDMLIESGPLLQMAVRDTVLVATDGLFDNLHVAEVVERLRKGPLEEAVARLAWEATDRMLHPAPGRPSKPDDLTIVAYRRR